MAISPKVAAYQSGELDEIYPVGKGKYMHRSEMTDEEFQGLLERQNRIRARVSAAKAWDGESAYVDEYTPPSPRKLEKL